MAKLGTSSLHDAASRHLPQYWKAAFSAAIPLLALTGFMLFAFAPASAQTPAKPQLADCNPGKLTDYLQLNDQGCAVGKYRLSNFAYSPGPDGLHADAISITAGISPGSDDPGILIEGNWSRPLRQPSIVSYTVEPLPAGRLLAGATLEMQFGQVTDTGEARVTTEICPMAEASGRCAVADLKLHVALSSTAQRKPSDNGRLPGAASHLRITNTVAVANGKRGAASFNGFLLILHVAGTSPGSDPP